MNDVVRPGLAELLALRHALAPRAVPSPGGGRGDGRVYARYGRGLAFAGTRPWQPGDDRRYLDWRQLARHGRPFSKDFRPEHERQVLIAVEDSPAMHFGTRHALKSATARRLAALLAWQAEADDERIGGGLWRPDTHRLLHPRARQAGVLTLLGLLAGNAGAPARGGLPQFLAALRPHLHADDRVHLIGSFADDDSLAPLTAALSPLSARLHLWLVADPLETAPPTAGMIPLAGRDGPQWLDLADPANRRALTTPFQRRRQALARLVGVTGGTLSVVNNTDDLTALLQAPRR